MIKKSALSATDQARTTIYVRSFTGPPSSSNERSTTSLRKEADVTIGGVVYQSYTNSADGNWSSGARGGTYWRFFISSPPVDQNSETLDFIAEKIANEIDEPADVWARVGDTSKIPSSKLPGAMENIQERLEIVDSLPSYIIEGNLTFTRTTGFGSNVVFTNKYPFPNRNYNDFYFFQDGVSSFGSQDYQYMIPYSSLSITVNSESKTISKLVVNDNEYNLRRTTHSGSGQVFFISSTIASADRISDSKLTQRIRFKFSDGTYLQSSGGAKTGDLALLREGNELNLWYFTGPTSYRAILSSDNNKRIEANLTLGSGGSPSDYGKRLDITEDDNYVYALYLEEGITSNIYTAGGHTTTTFLKRWNKQTRTEDTTYRKRLHMPSSSSLINNIVKIGDIIFVLHNWTDRIFTINNNTVSTQTINLPSNSQYIGVRNDQLIFFMNLSEQIIYYDVNGTTLSNRYYTTKNSNASNVILNDDDYYWSANITSKVLEAYKFSDHTRDSTKDLRLPLLGGDVYFDANRLSYPRITANSDTLYYILSSATSGAILTNPGDIEAVQWKGGGWQNLNQQINIPNTSLTLQGSGPPRANLGADGHFYWDTLNDTLYVKEDSLWHIQSTPAMTSRLPAESTSKEGEDVYVSADYPITTGFNITPVPFAETSVDGFGAGTRGWWRGLSGYSVGRLHPDDSEIQNVLLISDTRVYVKRNTLTNLKNILLGATKYALVRVPQGADFTVTSLPNSPPADYYTITGGLPEGDWDDVRFETTTANDFIPATANITKGLYSYRNSDWQQSGFYAPQVNPEKDMIFQVEEITPGAKTDKNLALAASGSNFTIVDPFPGILRLTFNADSSETDLLNRYSVFVPINGGDDSDHPTLLEVGTKSFPLSYYSTGAGQAIYRTSVLATADRVTSAGTITGVNIQKAEGSWAGVSEAFKSFKTLSLDDVAKQTNVAQKVHAPPSQPSVGERIEMLDDATVQGGAVLTAAEATGNEAGHYAGYLVDAAYSVGTGDLGSLSPPNATFRGLLSYSSAYNTASYRDKTVVSVNAGYTPRRVFINGTAYAVTRIGSTNDYILTGLDGSSIIDGHKYYVNVDNSSQTRLFPDVTLRAGVIYLWDGIRWVRDDQGQSAEEVTALINNKVPQQFRSDANVSGNYFQPSEFWSGTSTQEAALTKKDDGLYFTTD